MSWLLALAAVGLFAGWQGSSLTLSARIQSAVPRTIHVKLGHGRQTVTAGIFKVNSESAERTQRVGLGWSPPPLISLIYAERTAPIEFELLEIRSGFGLRLETLEPAGPATSTSPSNRAQLLETNTGFLRAKQWLAAGLSVLFVLLAWEVLRRTAARFWFWFVAGNLGDTSRRCLREERALRAENPESLWCGWRGAVVLAVFPAGVLLVGFLLMEARGPIWFFYRDPEYAYVFSSLNLLRGLAPLHTDHPGTPLQLLGALVMGLSHLPEWGGRTLAAEILRDAESHLHTLNCILLLLTVLSTWCSGLAVSWACRSVIVALLAQTAAFAAPIAMAFLHRATPEMPLMIVAQLAGTILIVMAVRPGLQRSLVLGTALGVLGGMTLALKVTSIPLLAFLVAVRGWRRRLLALGLVMITFLIATVPIWQHYGKMVAWLTMVGGHTGFYGEGREGVIDLAQSLTQFRAVAWAQWPAFGIMGFGAVALAAGAFKSQGASPQHQACLFMLALCLAASAGVSLLTFKHPYERYLVPAIPLGGAISVLSALVWGRHDGSRTPQRLQPFSLFVGALTLLFVHQAVTLCTRERGRRDEFAATLAALQAFVRTQPSARAASHINGPTLEGALLFGRYFTDPEFADAVYNDAFDRLFPGGLWAQHPRFTVVDAHGKPFDAWNRNGVPVTVLLIVGVFSGWDPVALTQAAGYDAIRAFEIRSAQIVALRPSSAMASPTSAP